MKPDVFCTACNLSVTMHADASLACGCEGPLLLQDGGDPIPESWEMPGEDQESAYEQLRRWQAQEMVLQEVEA